MVKIEDEDDAKEDGPGLINLEMKDWGSGSMQDPLRHAMGLRNAQDQKKMTMWQSFPGIFQNTIFHGEQDASIKKLRHEGTVAEKLERAKEIKAEGNVHLKAVTSQMAPEPAKKEETETSEKEVALIQKSNQLEDVIVAKEQELKALRQELNSVKAELEQHRQSKKTGYLQAKAMPSGLDTQQQDKLKKAIQDYEKAAGILRYVECIRPDWKNDDGSYKGIEDQWLKVDSSALEGDDPAAEEAQELVTSCYLNIALASQKLEDYDQMKKACDEILDKVNPKSVKALYRRAQARIAPTSALDTDRDAAIKDLHMACQLAPKDQEIRKLFEKLKTERKSEKVNDRSTFGGLFDRGSVVTNDPREEGEKLDPSKLDLDDPKVQAMLDIRPGPFHGMTDVVP